MSHQYSAYDLKSRVSTVCAALRSVLDYNLKNPNLQDQLTAKIDEFSSLGQAQATTDRQKCIDEFFWLEPEPKLNRCWTLKAGNIIVAFNTTQSQVELYFNNELNEPDAVLSLYHDCQDCMTYLHREDFEFNRKAQSVIIACIYDEFRDLATEGTKGFLQVTRTDEGVVVDAWYNEDAEQCNGSYATAYSFFADGESDEGLGDGDASVGLSLEMQQTLLEATMGELENIERWGGCDTGQYQDYFCEVTSHDPDASKDKADITIDFRITFDTIEHDATVHAGKNYGDGVNDTVTFDLSDVPNLENLELELPKDVTKAELLDGVEKLSEAYDAICNIAPLKRLYLNVRQLWWVADSMEQAREWKADLEPKGCSVTKLEQHKDSEKVDVVFSLDANKAKAILGYQPEECEWLDESDD